MRTSTSRRARRPWTWPGGGWPLRSCSSSPSGWSGSARRREVVHVPPCGGVDMELFYRALPFTLTDAQRRCVEEALADMRSGTPMNRLCQGDVGSGKTMVAAACVYFMREERPPGGPDGPHGDSGPAALPGPGPSAGKFGYPVRPADRLHPRQDETVHHCSNWQSGEIDFAIGTHALITGGVAYRDLGLVVTDEQHRFGVAQRAALAAKGDHPHILVMSATPIPRTLALILYGDLDVSIIDQLPPGRQPVQTFAVPGGYHQRVYALHPQAGGRGPPGLYRLSHGDEENDELPDERKAVTEYAKKLQSEVFPDLQGGLRPRQDEAQGEGRRHGRLRRPGDGHSGVHHRHRGGGGRAQRRRDGDRERGAVRPLPAPPAAGPGGPGEAPVLLHPDLRQPKRGDAAAAEGHDQDHRRLPASPRRTCGSGAPATSSARASTACRG